MGQAAKAKESTKFDLEIEDSLYSFPRALPSCYITLYSIVKFKNKETTLEVQYMFQELNSHFL